MEGGGGGGEVRGGVIAAFAKSSGLLSFGGAASVGAVRACSGPNAFCASGLSSRRRAERSRDYTFLLPCECSRECRDKAMHEHLMCIQMANCNSCATITASPVRRSSNALLIPGNHGTATPTAVAHFDHAFGFLCLPFRLASCISSSSSSSSSSITLRFLAFLFAPPTASASPSPFCCTLSIALSILSRPSV